jgi:hypothetical protein
LLGTVTAIAPDAGDAFSARDRVRVMRIGIRIAGPSLANSYYAKLAAVQHQLVAK